MPIKSKIKARKPSDPTRIDPTKTVLLRKQFGNEVARRFAKLGMDLYNLVVKEDALGLKDRIVGNVFCPTGEGGGIDPTCSSGLAIGVHTGGIARNLVKAASKGLSKAATDTIKYNLKSVEVVENEQALQTVLHQRYEAADIRHRQASYSRRDGILYLTKDTSHEVIAHELGHVIDGGFEDKSGDPSFIAAWKKEGSKLSTYAAADRTEGIAELFQRRYTDGMEAVEKLAPGMTKALGPYWKEATNNSIVTNLDWTHLTSAEKIRAFSTWLRGKFREDVTKLTDDQVLEKYIKDAFLKGSGRAFDDTKRVRGITGTKERMGLPPILSQDYLQGSRDQFIRGVLGDRVTVDKLKLIVGRTWEEIDGLSQQTASSMTRILADGLVTGKGPREVARDLDGALDLGKRRSLLIASDAIVRAHNEGQLAALDELGVEEVGVSVEWMATMTPDGEFEERVCPRCRAMAGVVLKIDEARGMLPAHNGCRCAWIPAGVGEDRSDQKRSKRAIDDALDDANDYGDEPLKLGQSISKSRPEPLLNIDRSWAELYRFSELDRIVDPPITCNYIRKLPSGEYRIYSEEGKTLGTYDTREEAEKRLRQIEYFKHVKNVFCPTGEGGGVDPTCSLHPGSSSGTVSKAKMLASDKERIASHRQAQLKIKTAPVPSAEDVAKARVELENARKGLDRAGGESRGGSAASRRKQRENLFNEFGGKERGYVVCPWTGARLHWTDDPILNPHGYPKFERGKIFVKCQGGGYQLSNLIPESFEANRSRNDKRLRRENAKGC